MVVVAPCTNDTSAIRVNTSGGSPGPATSGDCGTTVEKVNAPGASVDGKPGAARKVPVPLIVTSWATARGAASAAPAIATAVRTAARNTNPLTSERMCTSRVMGG
jgi:hypothetical protein